MPSAVDILQFLHGQIFQMPKLPRDANLSGKTVIVTGANTGLGLECAKHLVRLNVKTLILGCRSVEKGLAARGEIVNEIGQNTISTEIEVWELDMACYDSVKTFAERAKKCLPRLDALIANAGISTNIYHHAESFEETLTVNVISTFLLSLLCVPLLRDTAKASRSPTHLVVVGSNVHAFADHTQLSMSPSRQILRALSDKREADMKGRYFLSKLLVLLCTREMAKQLDLKVTPGQATVILNCPSPGWCKTSLFRTDDGGLIGRVMLSLIGRNAETGARTLVCAMTASTDTHGQYLSECQVKPTSSWARSEEAEDTQRRLWADLMGFLDTISPEISSVFTP